MMNLRSQASIRDEEPDSGAGTGASRLLPPTPYPPPHSPFASPLQFGVRAAVLAGVVATACATVAPAASAAGAPAAHASVTVTLNGPAGGFITPADSTCCI